MRVDHVRLSSQDGVAELSAEIDGFRLWYRCPAEYAPPAPGDIFLAAALLVAMRAGETLEIGPAWPCSTRLLAAARGPLQEVFSAWYTELKPVEVRAEEGQFLSGRSGVASFFSGGVDGSYTLLRNQAQITHLIFVKGIDMQVDNDALWEQTLAVNRAFAEDFGKILVPVVTNIRDFCHPRGVPWTVLNGAGLASIAHALGFHRCYVAASHTYAELFPWGSHPLTDPLWSSDAVEIVHDGPASRADKLRAIGRQPEALRMLRVCWQDRGYNCGRCEKCIRTRATLRLLGLSTPTLPPLEDPNEMRRLTVWEESELSFFKDNLRLAEAEGDRPLAAALRSSVRRYHLRKAMAELDQHVFKGFFRRLKSYFRTVRPGSAKSPSAIN